MQHTLPLLNTVLWYSEREHGCIGDNALSCHGLPHRLVCCASPEVRACFSDLLLLTSCPPPFLCCKTLHEFICVLDFKDHSVIDCCGGFLGASFMIQVKTPLSMVAFCVLQQVDLLVRDSRSRAQQSVRGWRLYGVNHTHRTFKPLVGCLHPELRHSTRTQCKPVESFNSGIRESMQFVMLANMIALG
jgi:hypothetical protein